MGVMGMVCGILYGLFAFVAVTNWLLMGRPKPGTDAPTAKIAVLIPARDEAINLAELLPLLVDFAPVFVFDDESSDGTAEVAEQQGAVVIRPREPLPKGWAGKNRACHELARAAAESGAEWFLFLDADVRTTPDFLNAVRSLIARSKAGVITGFPTIVPGRGIEPLFLAWVGWILLSSNPFGVVSRVGKGHNRFTNGQFHCWHRDIYLRLQPNEAVKGHIMEDVMMGRLLAKHRVPVLVANVSSILSVKMYDTWRQTLDGMSKNSFEITGNVIGSYAVAALLLAIGWLWLLSPWTYSLLALSGIATALTVRAKPIGIAMVIFTMPIVLTIGAFTILRSVYWRLNGKVVWKGRTYT